MSVLRLLERTYNASSLARFLITNAAPSRDLPQSGQPRSNGQIERQQVAIEFCLCPDDGARAYEGHLAAKHVE
jgi:hypothetical protein